MSRRVPENREKARESAQQVDKKYEECRESGLSRRGNAGREEAKYCKLQKLVDADTLSVEETVK